MKLTYRQGRLLLSAAALWLGGCTQSGIREPDISGTWSRPTSISCTTADIDISHLSGDRYTVSGIATWCPSEEVGERGGINVGELDFTVPLVDGVLRYEDPEFGYSIELRMTEEGLEVVEEGMVGYHGLNVTFNGTYRRTNGA